MGFRTELFKEPPDSGLICPLCEAVFDDPVTDECGHVFCKTCIRVNLRKHPSCPLTGEPIQRHVKQVDELQLKIDCLLVKCVECGINYIPLSHYQEGCPQCRYRRANNRTDAYRSFTGNHNRPQPFEYKPQKTELLSGEKIAKWAVVAGGLAAGLMVFNSTMKKKPSSKQS